MYIHILYETLISFASYHMIHDYTSRYIKSDTENSIYSIIYLSVSNWQNLRTSHNFSSIGNRYLIYDSDTLIIIAL